MRHPQIRPRFEQDAQGTAETVIARFKHCDDPRFVCAILGEHIQISMNPEEAHLWSPFLTLEVNEVDGRTQVSGRFSSSPEFFTMYLFSMGIVILSTLGFGTVGLSQWMLGMDAWALWSIPIGVALIVGLWAVPFVGQRLAHEQLEAMHARVTGLLHATNANESTTANVTPEQVA